MKSGQTWIREQCVIIRTVTQNDKQSICLLSDQINQDHFKNMPGDFRPPGDSSRDWEHWLAFMQDERAIFLVAEETEMVVGFVAARVIDSGKSSYLIPKKKLQIATIVVLEEERGKGVGRALVGSAIASSQALGATEVFLEVMAYNTGAQKFYESLGFVDFSRKLSKQLPA